VIPGLLLALGYAILNYFLCHRYMDMSLATEVQERPLSLGESMTELGRATWSALPALGCPLVILVGIYGGIFTPNEAGAIAVVYCLFVGFFVYRELNRHTLWSSIFSSLVSIGVITILIAAGTVFARYLIRLGVAQELATFILQLFSQKILVLLAMNAFLLFLGMFIDGTPILILAVPLILPLVTQLGVNLVHLGAIVILNIGLGVITPPFAISIFVGSRLSGCSYTELVPIMLRFLLFVGIPVLLLTTYIPAISCWLPTLLLGPKVVGPW